MEYLDQIKKQISSRNPDNFSVQSELMGYGIVRPKIN